MNTLTPQQLSSAEKLLASQGHAKAKSLLAGGPGIGSFTQETELSYETVWRPENLPAPFWSDLGSKEQDRLMDAFAEAFKSAFQPVGGDSKDSFSTLSSDGKIERYLMMSPEWLTHAFNNDPCIHRTLVECSLLGKVIEDVWPVIAARMYKLKNTWEGAAMSQQAMNPSPHVIIQQTSARSALLIEAREALKLVKEQFGDDSHLRLKPAVWEVVDHTLSKLQSIKL